MLGGVVVAILLLTVLGYMLAEEDDLAYLLVTGLFLAGVAALFVVLGLRLLDKRR